MEKSKMEPNENVIFESYRFEAPFLAELHTAVQEFLAAADTNWIAEIVPPAKFVHGKDMYQALVWFEEEDGPCYVCVPVKDGRVLKTDVYSIL